MANEPTDTTQQVRNVGSSYTTFVYQGQNIAYLEAIADSGQEAISANGAGYEFIHPLGARTPTDIVTSRALDGGVIQVQIRELWHQEIWEQLQGLEGAKTITDIFDRLAASPQYVSCSKIITPPDGQVYGKIYHRCVIVKIQDSEQVQLGTLSVPKTISIAYTHTTHL